LFMRFLSLFCMRIESISVPFYVAGRMQVAIKCLTHMGGQLFTGLGQAFDKAWVVALDDRVEQCLLGPEPTPGIAARFVAAA
ncbi:MAG: hypothetical protein RQ741_05145, partial [Wenzhouxiangellaceae bacterium]|nr:hypothetical protein [Wenzhouxiangellaceae bacterium]